MPAPTRKIRVLFIDDDGSIRIFAEAMFNNHIFDITVAADAKQADFIMKTASFDAIVCDVMMPGEDGIEFCNRLKKTGNSVPFVFLSAVSDPNVIQKGLVTGAHAYFVKPFDSRELQKRIIDLVRSQNRSASRTPERSSKETSKLSRWFNRGQ